MMKSLVNRMLSEKNHECFLILMTFGSLGSAVLVFMWILVSLGN